MNKKMIYFSLLRCDIFLFVGYLCFASRSRSAYELAESWLISFFGVDVSLRRGIFLVGRVSIYLFSYFLGVHVFKKKINFVTLLAFVFEC